MIEFQVGRLRQEGTIRSPLDALVRTVGKLAVRVGDQTVLAEPDVPVLELAAQLAVWLRDPRGDFSYDSVEYEDPGVLWIRQHSPGRVMLGSTLNPTIESEAIPVQAVHHAVELFMDRVKSEASRFGLRLDDMVKLVRSG
jgi:hypothetical protein